MKLIIELSENDYKALKEDGVQNHLALADTIIACSVPYEERSQSEWIDYNNTFYKCPECGYLLEKCCPQCQTKIILPTDTRGKEEWLVQKLVTGDS